MNRSLLVNGSLGESSYCDAIINYITSTYSSIAEAVDFKGLHLPFELPQYHKKPRDYPNENVHAWLDMVESSHSIVLISPLYHGSISGVLKNALDLLCFDQFRNKKVGVIIQCGNVRAGAAACVQIRSIIRTLYGSNIQTHIISGAEDFSLIDNKKQLHSAEIKLRIKTMMQELATV